MRIVAIVPVRMSATRFPGKPLAPILGLPMIEHVRRRAALCTILDDVIVATCDEEIRTTVEQAGGKVVMTSDHHKRCTDRIAEASRTLKADIVVNVQGDEPLILPRMIEEVVAPLEADEDLVAVNLVTRITEEEEFEDRNAPKVVADLAGNILYISREPIPSCVRAGEKDITALKQLGIIAFRSDFLQRFCTLTPTPLEELESIDMLRALEHGYPVRAVITSGQMIGVDLPGDVVRVERALATDPYVRGYLSVSNDPERIS